MRRREFIRTVAGGLGASQVACGNNISGPEHLPTPIEPDASGLYHPDSIGLIGDLIQVAREHDRKIRVRGSAHSVSDAIFTVPLNDGGIPERGINLMLDQLRTLTWDDANMRVTAQAGCNLGEDPSDPSEASTLENSLLYNLDRRGWALPDTGGIIHQTVGGFLATGSSGGSLQDSVYDSIRSIRLIDGRGEEHLFERPSQDASDPDNPFFAAVISMGLLGIVTEVTFQAIDKYLVRGDEQVFTVGDSNSPFSPFVDGPDGLAQFFHDAGHSRILWWPQPDVNKLQIWQAQKTGVNGGFVRKEWVFLTDFEQAAAREFFEFFDELNPPNASSGLLGSVYALAVDLFFDEGNVKDFWDDWWKALPMDNGIKDDVLPTTFTELWIAIERTNDVMQVLRDHFASGFGATGTHACEIYAAKGNPFWMSPGYGRDSIRIDPFWFADSEKDPSVFFGQCWDLLEPLEPRYHWGKHLPVAPTVLRERYPRWDDFLELRAEMDPNGVFLTDYWRSYLGI